MNIDYKIKPPQAGNSLYKNIFKDREEKEIVHLISDGLISVMKNSSRLMNDVKSLLEANSYASALFLLTTADEEMAKSYILLDLCRLDFRKYESDLRCLCRAFYNHVIKHAYTFIHRLDRINDLAEAREIWEIEIKKWWPNNDPESGEPDMPHDTVFYREMPLYVDYIEYDQQWSLPNDEHYSLYFEKSSNFDPISISKKYWEKIEFSHKSGLFKPSSLSIFHDIFKKYYVKRNMKTDDLIKIYSKIDKRLFQELEIPTGTIFESIYFNWPLYNFLTF